MWWSPDFMRHDTPAADPGSGLPFSEDYFLTGIAQTLSVGLHEETWLHAQVTGRTDTLTLFKSTGATVPYGFLPVEVAAGAGVIESAKTYAISQVCDMAGLNSIDGDLRNGRLFLSVIACAGAECAGGLVEATTETARWSVRILPGGAQQATLRGLGSVRFPAACMPIATTGFDSFDQQYVAVASPAAGDFLIFRAGAMDAGPTGALRILKTGYKPADLVILRKDVALAALVILWKSDTVGTQALLEGYRMTNGDLSGTLVLSYPVPSTTMFIESPGFVGGMNRDLYTFAPEGIYRATIDLTGL
jgi:hypothetical protein